MSQRSPNDAQSNATSAKQVKLQLRCVRRSDTRAVQRLFVQAILTGPGSPNVVALRNQIKSYLAYTVTGAGILLAAFAPSGPYRTLYRIGGIAVALIAIALILRYRYDITGVFTEFCNSSVQDDLRDVVGHYRINEVTDAKGKKDFVFSGASAFWVIEAVDERNENSDSESEKGRVERNSELGPNKDESGGKLVGCIGLDVPEGTNQGSVRRMVVSPSLQGRGVGKMLLNTVLNHARDHGVKSLRLTTSVYQPRAIHLYEKAGWFVVRTSLMGDGWFKLPLLHFNNELGDSKEAKA